MKILLINGSPNKNGCTFTALSECAKAIEEQGADYEIMHIGNGPIHGCQACMACKKTGKCIFDDDICNSLSKKMAEADGIIIGSPVYYASINGSLSAILDRVFFSSGDKLTHKPAAAIVSCRRGGASAAFDRLNKYFTINEMPVVSSCYWNSVHGFTPDDVMKDKEGIAVVRTLGKNMVHMIDSFNKSAIQLPEHEKRVATNFADGK